MDDLCFYWKWHGQARGLNHKLKNSPLIASYFLQKIIASNYLILAGYLESCLNELETAMRDDHIDKGTKDMTITISKQWAVLQSWSHRFPEYCGMLEDIHLMQSKLPEDALEKDSSEAWAECVEDFAAINHNMTRLRERTATLAESFVGLASMAGMQESLDEAKNVQILTLLGIFFLPLSWIASIFALEARPDPEGLKLYSKTAFPTAVGLTLVVLLSMALRRNFRHDHARRPAWWSNWKRL